MTAIVFFRLRPGGWSDFFYSIFSKFVLWVCRFSMWVGFRSIGFSFTHDSLNVEIRYKKWSTLNTTEIFNLLICMYTSQMTCVHAFSNFWKIIIWKRENNNKRNDQQNKNRSEINNHGRNYHSLPCWSWMNDELLFFLFLWFLYFFRK